MHINSLQSTRLTETLLFKIVNLLEKLLDILERKKLLISPILFLSRIQATYTISRNLETDLWLGGGTIMKGWLFDMKVVLGALSFNDNSIQIYE